MFLRKFQTNDYMIGSGTYNLVFIMKKMKNLNFTYKAMIAIKKAT